MPRRDDAPRDLLFGMLALQNGLITRDQLVTAFALWTASDGRPMADVLTDQGALAPPHRALVEALVEAHLKLHGGDAEKSLAALDLNPSTRRSLAAAGGPEVEATLAHVGSGTDPGGDRTGTFHVGSTTSDGQRFRVLRPHARGGLGAVYVALDSELNREVALKQILDHHADDPASRQRFLIEAEITGGLEHPGIVPVYGLGTYDGGRPYYAMRFIRGDSLKEAIERFHAPTAPDGFRRAGTAHRPGADGAAAGGARPAGATRNRGLELRRLLRRFLDVCNAIEYAHSRGVLHRDLKPGNVIVGRHGETLVVDWGLAKPLGTVDPAYDSDERALTPSSASGTAETLPGQALGTPAYMSPEQAAGDLEKLGPQSDVYSLGATLYCLLTGRAPFEGDVFEVLRNVQKGAFPPPRQIDPTIDRALEAVCLKAMATRPDDRYASCRALAEDVERWAADEPVSAWREPWTRRARRWSRRHRTAVTAAAVLLVSATAALAASNVLVNRQRARAEENFRLARGAVDDMYTDVAQQWLAQEGALVPLQRKFLEKALAFYERFARPEGSSPELRLEAAKASKRVGEIQKKLGRTPAADAAFRRQLDILEGMAAAYPGRPSYRAELARALYDWAWHLWETGREPDGPLDRSLRLTRGLEGEAVPGFDARDLLANVYSRQGLILAARGRFREAEAAHRRTIALFDEAYRASGKASDGESRNARTYANLAAVLRQTGRPREAEAAIDRAVAAVDAALARKPNDAELRGDLAYDLAERAHLRNLLGRTGEAEKDSRRAADLADGLAAEFPAFPNYQGMRVRFRIDLIAALTSRGRLEEARGEFGRAIAASEALVRAHPDIPIYRRSLAVHRANLADLLHTAGRPADADREYREALRIAEALCAEQPGLLDYRSLRASYRSSLAFLLRATGRYAEAEVAYREVAAELDALRREYPELPQFRSGLASAVRLLGEVLALSKRPQESVAPLAQAVSLSEGLVAEFPDVPGYRSSAASALVLLAEQALDRGEDDAARGFNERAARHMEAALASDPERSSNRYLLSRVTAALAQMQARAGDAGGVVKSARRIEGLPRAPTEHYNAACFLALLAGAVRAGKFPEPERSALARSLADRAMTQLTRAVDGGYRNVGLLRKDTDLDLLRPRDDFRLLMMDLDMPAEPFAP